MGRDALQIYIGWDSREPVAYHVLSHSILRHVTVPVSITPLNQHVLRRYGIYTRERGATESTEFSITRFLVPYLSGFDGYSLFMDCDMLVQADITELWAYGLAWPDKAVHVCQHDYTPSETTKFLGQVQTAYPRKNWSSVMLFDNAQCRALTPDYVNVATGLELHRFHWTTDDKIGALPLAWNHLVGVYPNVAQPKNIHFTDGGPWFDGYEHVDYADAWREARADMLSAVNVETVA